MKEKILSIVIRVDERAESQCDPRCGYYLSKGSSYGIKRSWCLLFARPSDDLARCQDCLNAEKGEE